MSGPAVTSVLVTVPASTANLGPGFDALGMALALHDTVRVRCVGHGLRVDVSGYGADQVPRDERHLVVRALRAAAGKLGLDLPGLELCCQNSIPHSRGLGSSAAATVAGVAAAYGLAGRDVTESAEDVLQLAAGFEGHADNAAASLFGGAVVAWRDAGHYRAARLRPHEALRPIALVPEVECSTAAARGLLPDQVRHGDAAFNAGRAALAVHALTSAPELLLAATEDRLHQDYRARAFPASLRLVRALRAGGVAATVSGAGPAVLALTTDGRLPDGVNMRGFLRWPMEVDQAGVRVEPAE